MSISLPSSPLLAIENLDDLVAAVQSEAGRDDITTDEVREFVQRGEARLNRLLQLPEMEAVAQVVLTAGDGPLPDDVLAVRAVYDADAIGVPGVSAIEWAETVAGMGKVHCIIGTTLKVAPAADETVTLVYWQAIPSLCEETPTNWLLRAHPDVYFYATMLGFASRIADDDAVAKWKLAFDEVIGELKAHGARRQFGGPLRVRPTVVQVRGARI